MCLSVCPYHQSHDYEGEGCVRECSTLGLLGELLCPSEENISDGGVGGWCYLTMLLPVWTAKLGFYDDLIVNNELNLTLQSLIYSSMWMEIKKDQGWVANLSSSFSSELQGKEMNEAL